MEIKIAGVLPSDLVDILRLNESEVPRLGSADLDLMQWFADNAAYFGVARHEQRLAAFLVGLRPGTDYASPNYRWFCDRYDDFAYVDRVAVAKDYRRHRLASRLYEAFAVSVPKSIEFMTCEVNTKPPNAGSMRFHTQLGFEQVGTLVSKNESKQVAMLARKL
ncbi:MAG: GNAT family N-acetyltransferase [Proteobacteria bacterium]|nr:GNAT family N-acetyltransferase [Pseudomonadota bacterium]